MADIRIAIIGFGKIAKDQHVPVIAGNPAFRLVAAVARHGAPNAKVPVFTDHRQMLQEVELDAVAICTPPGARHAIARDCLEAGLHVLLEKPPCSTLGEVADLAALSQRRRLSLFTTWHAQFNECVDKAAMLIREQGLQSMRIDWLEDVEKWHPGQQWIWGAGGFGVFDAGINALSIATRLSPSLLVLRQARMVPHPAGQQPIAATLEIVSPDAGAQIEARFDWRHKGEERWTIEILTRAGTRLLLSDGGAVLQVGDADPIRHPGGEYAAIYGHFAHLISTQQSHVDVEPLRLTADAYLLADRSGGKAKVLGWKLDKKERASLLESFPPAWPDVIADHITLDAEAGETAALPVETAAEIVGSVNDGDGLQALVVAIGGTTDRPDGSTFHITWSLDSARRRKAVESNDVIARRGWTPLDEPIPIRLIPAQF